MKTQDNYETQENYDRPEEKCIMCLTIKKTVYGKNGIIANGVQRSCWQIIIILEIRGVAMDCAGCCQRMPNSQEPCSDYLKIWLGYRPG